MTRRSQGIATSAYAVNSDDKCRRGIWKLLLAKGLACSSGPFKYGQKLRHLVEGGRVFLFVPGLGIMAEGRVEQKWSKQKNSPRLIDWNDNNDEYSVKVNWVKRVDKDQVISCRELRRLGQNFFRGTVFSIEPDVADKCSAELSSRIAQQHALETAAVARGAVEFVADPEGRRRIGRHVAYERSQRNRARAIQLHGTRCKACGFDFGAFYGKDLADDFIEIHHNTPVSTTSGPTRVNPETDLLPLCSNCHSMVHHRRGDRPISVAELQGAIQAARRR